MDTKTILLDVGGTFIKCSDGREIPVDSAGSREAVAASLRLAVGDAQDVAVAIPGPFDYENGIFLMKHKFASVYGESFADLAGAAGRRFRFAHDVVAMLLGEMASGAGKDFGRVALVTLGTGLGFAMCIDGKVLTNEKGSPLVPVWNIPYRDGILEDYAAKRGFLRGLDSGITVKDLAAIASGSSPVAGTAAPACGVSSEEAAARFAEVGSILAEALESILAEYGIECLLFGGQISRSYSLFGPSLEAGLHSPALRHVGPVSDISGATFNGLRALLFLSDVKRRSY